MECISDSASVDGFTSSVKGKTKPNREGEGTEVLVIKQLFYF
jgi:hypothetical protein